MTETYLQISLLGYKKEIEDMKSILRSLGFQNQKIILDTQIESGKRAVIVAYEATGEQIERARKLFQYIQIREMKK